MALFTGDNGPLNGELLITQFQRIGRSDVKAWVDAGYCLDAPELLAAGSHERDEFGAGKDDWIPMPTMVRREPSNA